MPASLTWARAPRSADRGRGLGPDVAVQNSAHPVRHLAGAGYIAESAIGDVAQYLTHISSRDVRRHGDRALGLGEEVFDLRLVRSVGGDR